MSDAARQIERYLLAAGGWVAGRDLSLVFGVNERALRRDKGQPGLCSEFAISGPRGFRHVRNATAEEFSEKVEYPVIVRPSYVLSGAAMAVVHSGPDLEAYLAQAALVSKDAPVVISKFEQGAKEIEFDGVVTDVMAGSTFRVKVINDDNTDGHTVLCYLGGKIRQNSIKII